MGYRITCADLHAHLYSVSLTVAQPARRQQVSLPVWIPGSYLVREFSQHLQGLQASQSGRALALVQLDKCTWQINCTPGQPLELTYTVYAFDRSVRAAWLDAERGFFNATSLCLRVHGQTHLPHQLQLAPSKKAPDWAVATGLPALKVNRRGFGSYLATDYDELADCPVEMGAFWSGQFKACGVPHRLVVTGATARFDGERLLADAQKICATQIAFWRGSSSLPAPFKQYIFLLHAVDNDYGGLEHRNSTALICKRADLPQLQAGPSSNPSAQQAEGYTTLLGLISHEYFHTWNVKQLRPSGFLRYDYRQENYTDLLWFFEGFTSYYDDLLLRRAGLIDDATYLKLLNKNINQLQQTPGRLVQSVAQASFDAWIKYYRVNENTPNATVSYYGKGALVALCIDLTLRAEGRGTLDDVMRQLWHLWCAGPPTRTTRVRSNAKSPALTPEGGFTEAGFLAVLQACAGRSLAPELSRWVHSTEELPLADLLARHGVVTSPNAAPLAQSLGLRLVPGTPGLRIKTVLHGGAAQSAGLAAGDEWLGVWVNDAHGAAQGWRLGQLDDLLLHASPGSELTALVSRDQRLLNLPLRLPPATGTGAVHTWRLTARDAQVLGQWLGTNAPATAR